jgi:hypothetical protein
MRITIDIDGQQVEADKPKAESMASGGASPTGGTTATAPSEVLALAAAIGAINAGPAPAAAQSTAEPHAFHSQGAGLSHQEIAAAISAGSAQGGKPC